jgi:hypothetical protein
MLKREKLDLLHRLISQAEALNYSGSDSKSVVIDDIISYVQNTMRKDMAEKWVKRIKSIRWSLSIFTSNTPDSAFAKAWQGGKKELLGVLSSINREMELFEADDGSAEEKDNNSRSPIVFLSHSSSDVKYANALERFIISLGVRNEQLIYTSHALHKIPLDANIYDYLRNNIHRKIFMIILWSNKYLESPACLNEMGAAWVTQSDYTNIYVPNFSFGNPKYHECAVDVRKMGAVLNGDAHCKASMLELKNKILSFFKLTCDEATTQYVIDTFIKEISENVE